jgi:hypothetical protein
MLAALAAEPALAADETPVNVLDKTPAPCPGAVRGDRPVGQGREDAAHGTGALDAVRAVIERKPWLPPLPAID